MRNVVTAVATTIAIMLASSPVALAAKPAGVPPSGSACGAFYGSVVGGVTRGTLSGAVNPGVLHRGFADAEKFPGDSSAREADRAPASGYTESQTRPANKLRHPAAAAALNRSSERRLAR